jgi:hypothetical protein
MVAEKRWSFLFAVITGAILLSATVLLSGEYFFKPIDLSKISNYETDRVVFQHIEHFRDLSSDPSMEALLVIKDRKMFLLMDGYDNPFDAKARKFKAESRNTYTEKEQDQVWTNKINGKPDFIQIMDRRSPIMMNANEEYVSQNFGAFYKSIRDKFIMEHVEKYRQILRNRKDAGMYIVRKRLPRPMAAADAEDYNDRFYTSAKAKASDGTMYICEDADGDGVTETFIATLRDGFNWGYKSGPDLIIILKNTDKDIETLIGKLTNEALNGSVEDEKMMIETFPKEKDISDLVKWLTPKDPNSK